MNLQINIVKLPVYLRNTTSCDIKLHGGNNGVHGGTLAHMGEHWGHTVVHAGVIGVHDRK